MSRSLARRLRRATAGAMAIEFALTAMPLVMLIVGILQGGLMFWSWQALQAAAIDAARCAAIDSASCRDVTTTPSNTQSYAVSATQARGLTGVTTANVTVQTGASAQTTCGGTTVSMVSVALTFRYGPVFVWSITPGMTATACFPLSAAAGG
jgi:Flp pilus assembly protein TadG